MNITDVEAGAVYRFDENVGGFASPILRGFCHVLTSPVGNTVDTVAIFDDGDIDHYRIMAGFELIRKATTLETKEFLMRSIV